MSGAEAKVDEALLARLRGADAAVRRSAERELFERYHPQVERMLRRLLGPDTDDCVQEAFLDVFRGLRRFEGRARLSTWIYRVTLRRGWKCLAERRRGPARDEELPVDELEAESASVVATAETAELARRFERALDRLDLEQRTALALASVEGLGPPEIAAVLGIPVGTVHSRLHRARARMRELLGLAE